MQFPSGRLASPEDVLSFWVGRPAANVDSAAEVLQRHCVAEPSYERACDAFRRGGRRRAIDADRLLRDGLVDHERRAHPVAN